MKRKNIMKYSYCALIILFLLLQIFLIKSQFLITKEDRIYSIPSVIEDTYSKEDEKNEVAPPVEENPNTSDENKPSKDEPKPSDTKPNNNAKPNSGTNNNNNNNTNTIKPSDNIPIQENPSVPDQSKPKTIDEVIASMTIEEKIAQMLIITFNGTSMNTTLEKNLSYKPGGVILFAGNITDYTKTKKLISDINSKSEIAPFISVDQEGGRVQRVKNIAGISVTSIPPMWEIGATNDINKAYTTGITIGNDLKKFGFNLDFAPVIDVVPDKNAGVIKDRSFGSDPILVGNMGISLAKGLNETGVIPVYKHFPGHGATITDSHVALPIVSKTKEELMGNDLIPFKEAIKNNAKVIMVGHLAVPTITGSNIPASLSKEIIQDLLINELGYKGLVVTDALNMKAITDNYSEKQIYELAINAGVDILLMPKSTESAITNIKKSISEGKISEARINNAVKKILMLKQTYNIL